MAWVLLKARIQTNDPNSPLTVTPDLVEGDYLRVSEEGSQFFDPPTVVKATESRLGLGWDLGVTQRTVVAEYGFNV